MAADAVTGVDWATWVPIGIAAGALVLSFFQMSRTSNRNSLNDAEKEIDKANVKKTQSSTSLRMMLCAARSSH